LIPTHGLPGILVDFFVEKFNRRENIEEEAISYE
jgi:hypothetical protein